MTVTMENDRSNLEQIHELTVREKSLLRKGLILPNLAILLIPYLGHLSTNSHRVLH